LLNVFSISILFFQYTDCLKLVADRDCKALQLAKKLLQVLRHFGFHENFVCSK